MQFDCPDLMPTSNSLKVSPPSARTGGSYSQPPQRPRSLGYSRFALLLFLFVHALALYYIQPLVLDALCTLLGWGALALFLVVPVGFGLVVLWSLSNMWLRRIIHRSRAHSADRILRFLRVLAILVLTVEMCWLVGTVGLLVAADHDMKAYAWKMCFPKNPD